MANRALQQKPFPSPTPLPSSMQAWQPQPQQQRRPSQQQQQQQQTVVQTIQPPHTAPRLTTQHAAPIPAVPGSSIPFFTTAATGSSPPASMKVITPSPTASFSPSLAGGSTHPTSALAATPAAAPGAGVGALAPPTQSSPAATLKTQTLTTSTIQNPPNGPPTETTAVLPKSFLKTTPAVMAVAPSPATTAATTGTTTFIQSPTAAAMIDLPGDVPSEDRAPTPSGQGSVSSFPGHLVSGTPVPTTLPKVFVPAGNGIPRSNSNVSGNSIFSMAESRSGHRVIRVSKRQGTPGQALFVPLGSASKGANSQDMRVFRSGEEHWLNEFMRRVWPSVAMFIGNKIKTKLAEQDLKALEKIFEEIDRATAELTEVPMPIPPTHHWLNKVLAIFWPILSQAVNLVVKERVVPQIQNSLPSFLGPIEVDPCDLGDTPPKITSFKVLQDPISTGWMDMQCDLEYCTAPNLTIKLKNLTVGLAKLDFFATFYISFYGPRPQPPFFAGLSVYLSRAPKIDTMFTGMVEMLTQEFLNSIITKAVKSAMVRFVLPHRKIKLMVEDESVLDIIQPKPRGCLQITVLEAQNLVGSDYQFSTLFTGELTTDPYVRINIGSLTWRSPTIEKNTNPIWEEENEVVVMVDVPDQQLVELSIFDDGIRQQLKEKFKMGDSAADEVARLTQRLSVADLLGKKASELTYECENELWLPLDSWWEGRGKGMSPKEGEEEAPQNSSDSEDKEKSILDSVTSPWSWMKGKMDDKQKEWEAARQDECMNAEAKVKLLVHWKPLADPPETEHHVDALARASEAKQQRHQRRHLRKQEAQASGSEASESESDTSTDEDELEAPNPADEKGDDTDSEAEEVAWPTYVMSISLRQVDRLPCATDDAQTTFQVSTDVNRVVTPSGIAVHSTAAHRKALTTRYLSRANRPLPATISTLARNNEDENEVMASKVGTLMAQDVPVAVIADVLDIDEKRVRLAAAGSMQQASKLRKVEYNESALFLLPGMDEVNINFEISTIVAKVPAPLGRLHVSMRLNPQGVHRNVDRHPIKMYKLAKWVERARLTASIKVWPLVNYAPGLQITTQSEALHRKAQLEITKKIGSKGWAKCRVLRARGLRNADLVGSSDPFCVVKLGVGKKARSLCQTAALEDTLTPEWDHGPVPFEWASVKKALRFEVYDKDMGGSADLLGVATLPKAKAMHGFHSELSLGEGNGYITIEISPAEYKLRPDKTMYLHETRVPYQEPEALPEIDIYVNSAENLQALNLVGGKSDPYVICRLVNTKQTFSTCVIDATLNPTWNHGPETFSWGEEARGLAFDVYDKDVVRSKKLGRVVLDKKECLKGFDGWRSLGRDKGRINITVKKSTGPSRKATKLRITVVSAKDVKAADLLGTSDPYCICKIRGKEAFRTKTIWKTLSPVWDHPPEEVLVANYRDLKFEIYDKDVMSKDDFLGSAVVDHDMFAYGHDGDLSLGLGNGTLKVKLEVLGIEEITLPPRQPADAKEQLDVSLPEGDLDASSPDKSRLEGILARVGGRSPCSPASTITFLRSKMTEMLSPSNRNSNRAAPSEGEK